MQEPQNRGFVCACVVAYGPAGVLFYRDAFKCVRVCVCVLPAGAVLHQWL